MTSKGDRLLQENMWIVSYWKLILGSARYGRIYQIAFREKIWGNLEVTKYHILVLRLLMYFIILINITSS